MPVCSWVQTLDISRAQWIDYYESTLFPRVEIRRAMDLLQTQSALWQCFPYSVPCFEKGLVQTSSRGQSCVAKHTLSSFILGPTIHRTRFLAYTSPSITDAALTYHGNALLSPCLGRTGLGHLFLCVIDTAQGSGKHSDGVLESEGRGWENRGFQPGQRKGRPENDEEKSVICRSG